VLEQSYNLELLICRTKGQRDGRDSFWDEPDNLSDSKMRYNGQRSDGEPGVRHKICKAAAIDGFMKSGTDFFLQQYAQARLVFHY
jgi:hypothetical protein